MSDSVRTKTPTLQSRLSVTEDLLARLMLRNEELVNNLSLVVASVRELRQYNVLLNEELTALRSKLTSLQRRVGEMFIEPPTHKS